MLSSVEGEEMSFCGLIFNEPQSSAEATRSPTLCVTRAHGHVGFPVCQPHVFTEILPRVALKDHHSVIIS